MGCSRDSVASLAAFKDKYGIPFRLLADVDSNICNAFGVIVEKEMYGKKSLGIQRSTFLIAPDQRVAAVWPAVKVDGHAAAVLEAVP